MLKPSVEIHNMDGILVAEFWDCLRLDPAPVQDLRKHYEAHLQAQGRPELIVNLSGVDFAGSAALGNFVSLHRMVRQHGGRIVFCNVEPTVTEVFRTSKLDSLFSFESDREAALRAVREHPGRIPPKGREPARAARPAPRARAVPPAAANVRSPRRAELEAGGTPGPGPVKRRSPVFRFLAATGEFRGFPLIGGRPATMIALDGGGRDRSPGSRTPPSPGDDPDPTSIRANTRVFRGGTTMAVTPRIQVSEADGVQVIRFTDRQLFDERTVREVADQILAALPNDGRPIRLVLDFTDVNLVSSTLLSKLILLQRRVATSDGKLRLCEMSPVIQQVFRTSNLDRLFTIDRDQRRAGDLPLIAVPAGRPRRRRRPPEDLGIGPPSVASRTPATNMAGAVV